MVPNDGTGGGGREGKRGRCTNRPGALASGLGYLHDDCCIPNSMRERVLLQCDQIWQLLAALAEILKVFGNVLRVHLVLSIL